MESATYSAKAGMVRVGFTPAEVTKDAAVHQGRVQNDCVVQFGQILADSRHTAMLIFVK